MADFHKVDEVDRDVNGFAISISADGTTYADAIMDSNTVPMALGTPDSFAFPVGSTGRYVRLLAIMAIDDQWMSLNEVGLTDQIY